MYNHELKEQYISSSESRNLTIRVFLEKKFEQTEKFEKIYGTDICNFHIDQILEFYKSLCTTCYNSIAVLNSQLGLYTDWCLNNQLVTDHQNHFLEITADMMANCINKALAEAKKITREELRYIMEDIPNVSEQFLVLAIFEGICGEDYVDFKNLMPSDFNGNTVTLKNTNRVLQVSSELVSLGIDSAQTYETFSFADNYGDEPKDIKNLRYDGNDPSIIKRMSNAHDDSWKSRIVYGRLYRIRDYTGAMSINRAALTESGRIEMIQKLMENGNYSSVLECISANRQAIEYRYGKIQSIKQYLNRYWGEQ